ncbi:MAG: helix-turn-helix transcriptional regulator [Planctomycetota bacterium]|nr:helix-turn-helix transcriptional regulator [Planctomycetota bacterium]
MELPWTQVRSQAPLCTRPQLVSVGKSVFPPHTVGKWKALKFWCFNLYRYAADLFVEGRHYPIRPGCVSLIPPLLEMEYHFKTGEPQVHAHHIYPDANARTPLTPLPVVIDLGQDFERTYQGVEAIVGTFGVHRLRAEVRLWELLWEIAERAGPVEPGGERMHSALQRAVMLIEQRLAEPLRVEAIAEAAGISQNHLARLFQARFGTSVVGYLRRQRTERARYLLTASTQPIKAIAQQVGIPDLHLFNKVIRRELGRSPRQVRSRA